MEPKEYEIIRSQMIQDQVPSGSVLARVLANLPAEDVQKLRIKAAEGMLGLELEKMRMVHRFQASSAEIREFIDNIKVMEAATKGSFTSSYNMEGEFHGASGKTIIKSKKGCYIATVVYGSPLNPNVILLKRFRDKFLEKSLLGRVLSNAYNIFSPIASRSPLCRGFWARLIRSGLNCFCAFLRRFWRSATY